MAHNYFNFTNSTSSLTMVLAVEQTTVFFEDSAQMGLSNGIQFDSIQLEGVITVTDLSDWEDENWDQWCQNCNKPDRIQDQAAGAVVRDLINQVAFYMPVRSPKRLKTASRVVRY